MIKSEIKKQIKEETFFVVERFNRGAKTVSLVAGSPIAGDLIKDVITVYCEEDGVAISSQVDDHKNKVSVGFRVQWGDQYENGAENRVTEDFFRRIIFNDHAEDSQGIWLGAFFSWSVKQGEFEIRKFVFDSRTSRID